MTELRDKPHPSQCTATQTAALHQHHTTLFVQRQEQATSERLPLALEHYSKRQHLEPRFSALLWPLLFTIFSSSFCCSSGISSIPISSHPFLRPAPRQRYAPGPQTVSSGPLPQTAHDPLCCLRIHRVSLAPSLPLADRAVGVCPSSSVLTEAESSQGSRSVRESVSKKP